MRSDFAMLSLLQMQSTSDQQDFLKYPPIAAAAPAQMLPEQAASWAYPQPEMSEEEVAFCLATGLLGRFYVSGHLARMDAERLHLVAEAVSLAKSLRAEVRASTPFWPLGTPAWDDRWIALGLHVPDGALVTVWDRGDGAGSTGLSLPAFAGREIVVTTLFPRSRPEWPVHWNAETGELRVSNPADEVGARVLRIQAAPNTDAAAHSATRTQ
jgi:alpha-galactosidase